MVNTTEDLDVVGPWCTDGDPSTPCSFRQALSAATTDGDIVQLQAGATYLLSHGELMHDDTDLTIEGNGATVDGQSSSQVLRNGSGTLTVNDLTITNGHQSNAGAAYGGGLYAGGDAILDDVTITNSEVRARFGNSYGGGVYADGALTITGGTFTGNTAETDNFKPYGGGIAAKGTLTVNGATVTDNHNVRNGDDRGVGGGIFGEGLVAVSNSTVTGNLSMDAGGIGGDGAVTVIDSVVSDNSVDGVVGGVMSGVQLTISGSQINGNVAGLGDGTGVGAPTVSITGSQLAANKGGGAGGAVKGDTVTIDSSTLALNESTVGGAVWASGSASVTSSTIVSNAAYSRDLAQGGCLGGRRREPAGLDRHEQPGAVREAERDLPVRRGRRRVLVADDHVAGNGGRQQPGGVRRLRWRPVRIGRSGRHELDDREQRGRDRPERRPTE